MRNAKLIIITVCMFISACSKTSVTHVPVLPTLNKDILKPTERTVAKKLQLIYGYKEVELTSKNRKKLLYLYDWQQGVAVNYGQAKAKDEYMAVSIGHQRVQHLKRYFKNHKVVAVTYDPSLPKDTLLIIEGMPSTSIQNRP